MIYVEGGLTSVFPTARHFSTELTYCQPIEGWGAIEFSIVQRTLNERKLPVEGGATKV